jgi:hypothetical protein
VRELYVVPRWAVIPAVARGWYVVALVATLRPGVAREICVLAAALTRR